MYNPLIFGKNNIERIVSCEINNDSTELFIEEKDGTVRSVFKPNRFWLLAPAALDGQFKRLTGNLYYKYIKTYNDRDTFLEERKRYYKRDIYSIHDEKEAGMVGFGYTYYKGMKVNEVSVLSWDIESTSLEHTNDAKVLLISNTFRKGNHVERKLFAYTDYSSDREFFDAWSEWVRSINPSIIIGHNIYCYDLPYIDFCARKAGTELNLGRDGSVIKFNEYPSKFRKDGSQFYEYKKCYIYGREIVDTMFLAYKYDIGRKYSSYRLKTIIKEENLEVENRQFYDADTIRDNYLIPEEWEKIKKYAEHDADDALALYDLMIPAFFYLTPSIPKSFQSMMVSASGSQINAFLVRSYLQNFHSVPKATEGNSFEGGISLGNPGIYQNVFKVDVASLYPSIMLQYEVYDKYKDPNRHFLQMVEYFTKERLENKKLGKETGDRYYKDLEQAQKIIINSAYGMMGAPGLNFNSPFNAAFVTKKGREILQKSIDWATSNGFQIVNADTDSISITLNGEVLPDETRKKIVEDINSLYPSRIRFEDDGYYSSVVVVKAKNYVLQTEDGKVKTKGSALKATMKEKALKEFIDNVIKHLLANNKDQILDVYHQYVKEIYFLTDITRWSSKKTITDKVLNAERTNEQKVLDAIEGEELQEGDKIFVYFTKDESLKLQDKWDKENPDHDPENLVEKLYKTLKIFETVLDMGVFPKYHLKAHAIKCQLANVLGLPHPEKVKRTRKKKEVQDELPQTA
jgi:DNA polymerase elongation subunit (family B)